MTKNHLRAEKPDGNGFPGGVRMSWPALTVAIMALTFAFYLQERFERPVVERLTRMEEKLDKLQDCMSDHITDTKIHTYPRADSTP